MTARLVDGYDLVAFDLDGVVYLIDRPIAGAVEAIGALHGEGVALAYATNNASRRAADVAALLSDAYRLTAREAEVVALTVRGFSNAEIARTLWLSPWTVGDHLKNVFEKTGVRSRGELTSRLFPDHCLPAPGG